jgi:hypothetical protein
MSTSSQVYVGPYLYCKRRIDAVKTPTRVCENDESHQITIANFCPQCGNRIVEIEIDGNDTRSFYWTICDDDYKGHIPVDRQALIKYFSPVDNYNIGDVNDDEDITHDFLTIDELGIYIDGVESSARVHTQNQFKNLAKHPSQEMIDLLQQYMEYESIEIKYGVLVSVSY